MKWLLISIVILTFNTKSFAKSNLSQLHDILTKHPQVKGDFTQVRKVKDLKLDLKSEGNFTFKFPLNLTWNQEKPFEMDLQMTPEKIVQSNPDGTTVTISKAQQPTLFALSSSFLGVFSGDSKNIEKNFSHELSITKSHWKLNLKPKDEILKKAILNITVEGSEYVEKVEVTETSGGSMLIHFLNVKGA